MTTLPTLVAVGTSAGGLAALSSMLGSVTGVTGMAFVIVQHLSPDYKSMMTELLARQTQLQVRPAQDGAMMQAETVYVMQPQTQISLDGAALRVKAVLRDERLSQPIDDFFHSAAAYPGEIVAVVLSGTGNDGTHGIAAVKTADGTVLAQEPSSAAFDGMPQSAIRTGLVDRVLPADEIIAELLALRGSKPKVDFGLNDGRGEDDELLEFIFEEVRTAELRGTEGASAQAAGDLRMTMEELESANAALRSTNEALRAANEELLAANEELRAVNEALLAARTTHHKTVE